jgi:Dimerisation domain
MSQPAPGPRSDDRRMQDLIVLSPLTAPSLLVAHDLKLFSLLAEKSRTLPEICEACNVARRPAEALTSMCVSLGLLQLRDSRFTLTPLAEDYLHETSPSYWGGVLDFVKAN